MYYLSIENGRDGFGWQFTQTIYNYFIANKLNINFYFKSLNKIGHNYNNNNDENNLNEFINYKKLITNIKIDKVVPINNIASGAIDSRL